LCFGPKRKLLKEFFKNSRKSGRTGRKREKNWLPEYFGPNFLKFFFCPINFLDPYFHYKCPWIGRVGPGKSAKKTFDQKNFPSVKKNFFFDFFGLSYVKFILFLRFIFLPGWLFGYALAFDSSKSKLTKNQFGVGYSAKDFVLHTSVVDGNNFGGSVYQRISPRLETGVNLGWTASSNATGFGIGCKYVLDKVRWSSCKAGRKG